MPHTESLTPPVIEKDALRYSWATEQPQLDEIIVTPTHAYMSQEAFDKLPEYSGSIPTGVYQGKMWRAHLWDHEQNYEKREWFLRWYGIPYKTKEHGKVKEYCPTPIRRIVIR